MKKLFLILLSSVLVGCNMSDSVEKLTGGHTYVREGPCGNYLIINIDSLSCQWLQPVVDCKYNDDFICAVSTDTVFCSEDFIPSDKKKYTVIDVQKNKAYCLMSEAEFGAYWKKNIRDTDLLWR